MSYFVRPFFCEYIYFYLFYGFCLASLDCLNRATEQE